MARKRVRGQCDDCGVDLTSPSKRCRPCSNKARQPSVSAKERKAAWHREKKYGMEEDEFELYWQAQYGCCKICSVTMRRPLPQRGQPLDVVAVDHCHTTGAVRGLLCNGCNKALGLLGDSVVRLQACIDYLGGNHETTGNYSTCG